VKASEANLRSILEGNKQFLVPLFQRTYSWGKKEWDTLWGDLEELNEEAHQRNHFIGSAVTIPQNSAASGVAKFLLIDGQQRLTTILIILALLRDRAKELPDNSLGDEINDSFLANRYKKGSDHWKLLPTQTDREAYTQIMDGEPITQQTQIGKAAAYFSKRLSEKNAPDLEALQTIVPSKLTLVDIKLDRDEDPYLIFESLNAKGRPLTQADLIRNYFFMKIPDEQQQERFYALFWQPMQDSLGATLPEAIRHFLMRNGTTIKQGDTYLALKEEVEEKSPAATGDYLQDLARFAGYYAKLLYPDQETQHDLRTRLKHLNRLEVTVAYPFLLNVYDDYAQNKITAANFATILELLENFILRRAVCNVPRGGLNRIFPLLYVQASQTESLVAGVRDNLATKNYPDDADFREAFTSCIMYGNGARYVRTKLILERLETATGNKEMVPFANLSVEHVMPQTLTPWWKDHLGADYEQVHALWLHTIGNLTLTGYNSELSNSDFSQKRSLFAESHIGLNDWFQQIDKWNDEAIRIRAEALAERALAIWPSFGKTQLPLRGSISGITGKMPVRLVILDQIFPVTTWRDVLQHTLQMISNHDEDNFLAIAEKFPKYISRDKNDLRTTRQLTNGFFIETNMSALSVDRLCRQVAELAELSVEDWRVETI